MQQYPFFFTAMVPQVDRLKSSKTVHTAERVPSGNWLPGIGELATLDDVRELSLEAKSKDPVVGT